MQYGKCAKGFGRLPIKQLLMEESHICARRKCGFEIGETTFVSMSESEEIRNKVAESSLITFNLEDLYQLGSRSVFDLKNFLYEGLLLREKDFRKSLKDLDWSQYQDHYVAITCTADAIIPQWAYMLVSTYLQPVSKHCSFGDLEALETSLYEASIADLELESFQNERVVVKGCSKYPVPASAYVMLVNKLRPVVKSIMYGEACSTVPLFKR